MASVKPGTAPAPGLLDGVRSFAASWVALLRTRVDILALELEEQREWLEHLVIMAVAALFFLSMGLLLFTLFIVMLFWESYRLWVLGGFAVLYLGAGIVLFVLLRNKAKSKPRIFASTSSELSKDHAYLQPRNP